MNRTRFSTNRDASPPITLHKEFLFKWGKTGMTAIRNGLSENEV